MRKFITSGPDVHHAVAVIVLQHRRLKGRVSIRGFSWYLNMSIIFWEQIATYRGHASPKTLNQLEL